MMEELQLTHFGQEKSAITYENNTKSQNNQDCISFLALQASEIALSDEGIAPKNFSIENIPFIEIFNDDNSQIQSTTPKPRTRSPKPCRICSKSVLDLRRHLEQCHKELTRLQIVKIVAESKRFRKDLKKSPSKAVRNVLLCPHENENGEICNRPIVEYKLYQHLKFYHHIHPKSEEGIRLVRQARANPFAYKSIFHENSLQTSPNSSSGTTSSENSDPLKESDASQFDFDSEPYEVHVSFPGNECSTTQLPSYSDASTTHIIQAVPSHSLLAADSPRSQHSGSPNEVSSSSSPSTYSSAKSSPVSPMKYRQCVTASPNISCQVLSIGINIAVSCNNLPPLVAPQETTCVITKQEDDVVFISIPSLSVNEP